MPAATLAKYGYKDMHQFRNWRWYKGLGGGPLSDLGAHQIDIFNWWLGALPKSVMGSGGLDYFKNHDWYDNAMVIYEYPLPEGVEAMPTMGWLSRIEPVEPRNLASPKAKMPPSEAATQYPLPERVAAMPAIGLLSRMEPVEPKKAASPKLKMPPSVAVIQ